MLHFWDKRRCRQNPRADHDSDRDSIRLTPILSRGNPGIWETAPCRTCRRKGRPSPQGLYPSPRPRTPNAYSVVCRAAGETALDGWLRRADVEADVCLGHDAPRGDGLDDSKSQVWGDGSGRACTVEPLKSAAHSGGGRGRHPFVYSDGKKTAGTGQAAGRQKSAGVWYRPHRKGVIWSVCTWVYCCEAGDEFRTALAPSASPMQAACRPAAAGRTFRGNSRGEIKRIQNTGIKERGRKG